MGVRLAVGEDDCVGESVIDGVTLGAGVEVATVGVGMDSACRGAPQAARTSPMMIAIRLRPRFFMASILS